MDLQHLLGGLRRIEPLELDWAEAGRLIFALRRAGVTVPHSDALIAQQCRRTGAGVVHADHDFTPLCDRFGIHQEDFSDLVGPQG